MSKKVVYHISGFDCPNCAAKVERYLNKNENINDATIDFQNERLFITYKDEPFDIEKLISTIKEVEDDPLRIEQVSSAKNQKHTVFNRDFYFTLGRIVLSIIFLLIGRLVFGEEFSIGGLVFYLLSTAVVLYDIFWKLISNIIHLRNPIDMNLLLTMSSLGVFVLSILVNYGVLKEAGISLDMMDGAMVVILFQIGELFEKIASSKSKDAISNAIDLRADTANLVTEGKVTQVKPETLKVGDIIIVRIGEIIPADGDIIDGQGTLDMSSLTGEPMPVDVFNGMNVLSGSILKSGSITIKVNKVFADSTISKILELVQSSGEHKAKAEKFITKFARIYTPTVFAIGIIYAIVSGFFIGWSASIYRGLAILVVACPCAIVISVPLAYFAGIGLASKKGIVVKGANFLDSLSHIGTLFMDKTGTLTYGNFEIAETVLNGVTEEEFKESLLAAESRSNHPIAKAITLHQNVSQIALKQSDYEEIPGLGIKTKYNGATILAGNCDLLKNNKVKVDEVDVAGTAVYVAKDGKFIGYIVLKDVVRDKAKLLIKKLDKLGIKVVLLSGDKLTTVKEVAESVGITEYYAKLLPQDKTKFVEQAIENKTNKNKLVAFAGDGINDTPSIIRADVGYAMGGIGSDVAVENSDVVIMQDHPLKIYDSIMISKMTKKVAIFNIIFSLFVKVAVIVLFLTNVLSHMEVAILADTGLTVLMTLNSLLLIYRKVK